MDIEELKFPVLLFRDGYVYMAKTLANLVTHNAGTFDETANSKWSIANSLGTTCQVLRWERVSRPAGFQSTLASLTGSVFAKPILGSTKGVTLPQFIADIEPMLLEYRMYGNAYGNDEQKFVLALRAATSFSGVFAFIEDAV